MQPAFDDMDPQQRIAYLVTGFVQHTLTEEEHDELDEWVNASPRHTRLFEELTDPAAITAAQDWFAHPQRHLSRAAAQRLLTRRLHRQRRQHPARTWLRRIPIRQLAAATVFAALLIAVHYYIGDDPVKNNSRSTALLQPTIQPPTIAPPDPGRSEAHPGQPTAITPKATVTVTDNGNGYATATTPAGTRFQLTLGDGTRVWLNAASTLQYPTSFTNNNHTVSLQGEAYFETARTAAAPLLVQAGATLIQLSAAHANIEAYTGDEAVHITALQGQLLLRSGLNTHRLTAGRQAVSSAAGLSFATADTGQALAWKNGYFLFRNTPPTTCWPNWPAGMA